MTKRGPFLSFDQGPSTSGLVPHPRVQSSTARADGNRRSNRVDEFVSSLVNYKDGVVVTKLGGRKGQWRWL